MPHHTMPQHPAPTPMLPSPNAFPALPRSREPSRTLNAKETVSRGCALQCAMLSPTFRVRDFQVLDSFPYGVQFRCGWDCRGRLAVVGGAVVGGAVHVAWWRFAPSPSLLPHHQ